MMSTTEPTSNPSVLERILGISSLTIIAVALLSYFGTLIVGLNDRQVIAQGWGLLVYSFSLYALPVGFLLLITLLILAGRRRRRDLAAEAASDPNSKRRS